MKKIMLVDEYKIVNYAGGIERVLCNFANAFVEKGYDVTIVGLDTEKGLPKFTLDKRVNFVNLAFYGSKYNGVKLLLKKLEKETLRTFCGSKMIWNGKKVKDPKYKYFTEQFINRLRKVVNEFQPDVILSVSTDSAYFVQQAAPNIKNIAMMHTDVNRIVRNITERDICALKKAAAVQVLMPSFVQCMRKIGVKNVECIPNFVIQMDDKDTVNLSLDKPKYKVITMGRVEREQKRTHLLVEAFAKIAHKYANWELEIYGELDSKSYLKEIQCLQKKYDCVSQIHVMGPTHSVFEKLKQADIFAFPSAFEGFGLALTEAMSVGLPAIGYKNCSAVNEIIKDERNGLLCDDGVDALAKALEKLMDDKELRLQLGKAAKANVKQFAPEKVWNHWQALIEKNI